MMDLFSPLNVGNITLNNRIVMAPLTRCRSVEEHRANAMMANYYAQRASAGLIISEATMVSPMGMGYPATPGIYTPEQTASWKQVTQAVHDKGGKIYLQLWHVGRISHPSFLGGELPLAPSAVKPAGQTFTFEGMQDYVTPRPLETAEIPEIVAQYVDGAKNAVAAGFDGVEIHGANGYLIDQFLRDGTNRRKDAYGGSVENRSRFLLEIVEGVSAAIGADRTGVRLSPSGTFNDMSDSDPKTLFTHVLHRLSEHHLAYVHIVDALEGDIRHGANVVELAALRDAYKGVLITCGGYDKARGNAIIADGLADAVAYGLLYIANPDLPERFKADAPLNEPDPDTFYTQDEKGYLDYPTLG
ncbi:alkene reductase [Sulfurimonas sp. HSL-3221]|uniref:alkene reductase n=1 Tax=Sulfurimonadaceae TaxID=2771471 RepID=UPI001E2B7487|nr:alkene reductase [Sulfurimonas sp. HSL-3221]UFS63577.1 alkene reductase [Sulfurimonas sp. HSL-3221]